MGLFFSRFTGVLMLDALTFEEIEGHRDAAMQSVLTVMLACLAGGVAAAGLDAAPPADFLAGMVMVLGVWLVWVTVITALGTITFAEPQTKSNFREVLRTLGFAAAPGVFLVFASMRAAAPFMVVLVSIWMIAASVLGLRQALDYKSTPRAIAVCALGLVVSLGVIGAIVAMFGVEVTS